MKKHYTQAKKMFNFIDLTIGNVPDEEIVEYIREELHAAYLNGSLDSLKEELAKLKVNKKRYFKKK